MEQDQRPVSAVGLRPDGAGDLQLLHPVQSSALTPCLQSSLQLLPLAHLVAQRAAGVEQAKMVV